MKYLRYIAAALLALALVPAGVTAQQLSKGSIQGTVTDTTGAVVPDAKVIITSSFGTRETMTGPDGYFLVLALEPGRYSVKIEKQGFKAVELKDVDVRLNERANVNVKLEVGAVTQVVEVSETSVSIDPTTTTSGGSVTASIFLNAPVGRNITDIPYLVAGVNDSLGVGQSNPSISGATGFENLYVVNGVNITNTGYGAIGTYSNVYGSLGSGVQFDFVKEVQVKTSGFEAQYGQALGGVVNMITKSGGNNLFGGGYFYFAPDVFEAERRQPNAVRFNRGTETLGVNNYDLGGELGGYFIKDRAFWYGGYNAVWVRNRIQGPDNFRSRTTVGEAINQTLIQNYSAKVNFNATADQRHQVEASLFGDPAETSDDNFNRGLVTDFPDRRTSKLEYGSRNLTVRYNGAWTDSWLMNVSYSWAHNKFEELGFPNIYQVEDRTEATPGAVNPVGDGLPSAATSRGINQVGGLGFFENNDANNHQFQLNGTNTFRIYGSHQVDYGYQFEDIAYDWFHRRSGPNWTVPCTTSTGGTLVLVGDPDGPGPGLSPDCGRTVFGAALRLRTGGPSGYRFQQIRGAFTGDVGSTESKYHAIYLQDSWQMNKWITLKLGVRWEQQRIAGEIIGYTFAANWAPRLGIIVDPWADRKTKIFFNFGRFFEKVPQDLAVRSLSEERSYINLFFAVTNPTSANPAFNSTINPTPGCSATDTLISCLHNPANWILDTAHNITTFPIFSGGVTNFAAGTKQQYQDEYVVGIERDFGNGLLVSARYLDRRIQRVVEDVAALTVGGANTGVDIFGNEIHQTFIIANPSRNLDIFRNTLCHDGTSVTTEDPTQEDTDPNSATFTLGCLVSGGYAPGSGDPGADGLADGFPNPVRRYRAFEFSIEKRLTKNWQLMANWRISKLDGNYEGLFRNDNGQTDPNITSLFDFPFSTSLGDQFNPGVLPTDRRHVTNLYASYLWDNGFNMGVGWRLQSGYPIDRLGAHPSYLNQGEVPKNGRGSEGRSPVTSTIDWHGSYTWKVTERYRMKFSADIFNLWNARRVRRIDRFEDTGFLSGVTPPIQPNPDFLKVTAAADAYQRPLNARFSVRFEF